MQEQFFLIPDNVEIKVALIENVPSDWRRCSGQLDAPEALIHSGQVAHAVGFKLARPTREYMEPINVVGRYEMFDSRKTENDTPDISALIAFHKLPEFIRFNSFDRSPELTKHIAVSYIRAGYTGVLNFHPYFPMGTSGSPPSCNIRLMPWTGEEREEDGPQPARIRLRWKEAHAAAVNAINPLRNHCISLGLESYNPKKVPVEVPTRRLCTPQ